MPGKRSCRTEIEQIDLFLPPQPIGAKAPAWRQLPEETRDTATKLMARLLLDHARSDRKPAGGRHDI